MMHSHGKKVFKKDLAAKVLILVVMDDALAQPIILIERNRSQKS